MLWKIIIEVHLSHEGGIWFHVVGSRSTQKLINIRGALTADAGNQQQTLISQVNASLWHILKC